MADYSLDYHVKNGACVGGANHVLCRWTRSACPNTTCTACAPREMQCTLRTCPGPVPENHRVRSAAQHSLPFAWAAIAASIVLRRALKNDPVGCHRTTARQLIFSIPTRSQAKMKNRSRVHTLAERRPVHVNAGVKRLVCWWSASCT